jgi:hypothetical protein
MDQINNFLREERAFSLLGQKRREPTVDLAQAYKPIRVPIVYLDLVYYPPEGCMLPMRTLLWLPYG